jgi:hypothetical protein
MVAGVRKAKDKKNSKQRVGGDLVINNVTVTEAPVTVPEGWEQHPVIRKAAPWQADDNEIMDRLVRKQPVPSGPQPWTWDRGDYVSVTLDEPFPYEQLLVASDHPDVNREAWLVVADENDWLQVGTFKSNEYVADMNGRRIFRTADRNREAEPVNATPPAPRPPRSVLLQEADGLVTGDRNQSYGSPTENFQNTADIWTIQIKHLLKDDARLTAAHVAQLMMSLKLARLIAHPKRDNYVDIAGYAACGWECEEEVLNTAKAKEPSARRQALIPDEWVQDLQKKRGQA